jgi:hypothetical protein
VSLQKSNNENSRADKLSGDDFISSSSIAASFPVESETTQNKTRDDLGKDDEETQPSEHFMIRLQSYQPMAGFILPLPQQGCSNCSLGPQTFPIKTTAYISIKPSNSFGNVGRQFGYSTSKPRSSFTGLRIQSEHYE